MSPTDLIPLAAVALATLAASATDLWKFKVYNALTFPTLALGLAAKLEGRVVDTQLGETITAENRAASRAKAEEVAIWSKRLGTEFEQPEKAYVDEPAPAAVGAARGEGERPWWKFWARE